MNLTFRMLVNIIFKSITVTNLESYLYCINGPSTEPTQKNICSRNSRRFKRTLSIK